MKDGTIASHLIITHLIKILYSHKNYYICRHTDLLLHTYIRYYVPNAPTLIYGLVVAYIASSVGDNSDRKKFKG